MLVVVVKDMAGLADLYAVGVVGAIATNLGASSTDKKLGLASWERVLMFGTFLIMLAIEISLFADKPSARFFAGSVLVIGLILRGLANEQTRRKVLVTASLMVWASASHSFGMNSTVASSRSPCWPWGWSSGCWPANARGKNPRPPRFRAAAAARSAAPAPVPWTG